MDMPLIFMVLMGVAVLVYVINGFDQQYGLGLQQHRQSLVPLAAIAMLVLVAVALTVVPARYCPQAGRRTPRHPGATVEASADYARTPRTATPVDDRGRSATCRGSPRCSTPTAAATSTS